MAAGGRALRATFVFLMLAGISLQAVVTGFPARAQSTGAGVVAPCPALGGPYNRWRPLDVPAGETLAHLGAFAQAPCTLVGATAGGAVYRATDARTWRPVVSLDGLDEVAGVASEEMPIGTAFVFGAPATLGLGADGAGLRPSGMYATRDFGRTFEPVADLAGYSVSAVAAAPSDPQVLYAAASPLREARVPLILKSTDFGKSWVPTPASLPVRPTLLAVDARTPATVWANSSVDGSTPSTGVWRSTDGGVSFVRVRDETVVDFDTSPIPGGGSRVDMATGAGILRTRDAGATFRTVGDAPVAAITQEKFAPDALMAVVDSAAVRSTTAGRTYKPAPGLPSLAGCTVTAMTRNEEFPSHFLLSVAGCSAAGHYVYRSDGRDLVNLDDIGGEAELTLPVVGRLARTDMRILREIRLPISGDTTSGSLAFDGEALYYTNNDRSNEINVASTTGEHLRTITLAPSTDVRTLTYDPQREVLWALVNKGGGFQFPSLAEMYQIDPVTGKATSMFVSPLDAETTLSMDPTLGVFRSYQHHGYNVYEVSIDGKITDTCTVPGFPVDANASTNPDRGHVGEPAPGFASGLAVGGGKMYLQLEDDRTIYHVTKDCELLAVMEHRRFAESRGGPSGLENDQMACDTVTFGQPAIWIRDAQPNEAVAYAVPNGYCPLDSKTTLDPPKLTAQVGETVRACASLAGDGPNDTFIPVRGADVTFFSADEPVAGAATDESGRACARFEAPPGRPRTVPLEAAFLGSISFRASSGHGTLATSLLPPPEKPEPPIPPPPPIPPQVVLALPLAPVPNPPAGTAQAPAPQQQPQAQSQQQPQAQAQAAVARQQQEQTQLAFAFSEEEVGELSEEYAMSERRDRNARLSLQGAAAAITLAFGWAVTRSSLAYRRVRR